MIRRKLERSLQALWYGRSAARFLLAPLGWLYCAVVTLRRWAYARGLLRSTRLPARVVVVGNITVGGTGKTPLCIWMARYLRRRGLSVGVITGGYGGSSSCWPRRVDPHSEARDVGDESVLIARNAPVPVYAAPDRVAAGRALLAGNPCEVLISDDGLQHCALARDLEIAVIDGARGLGNRHCLPAGPLREPPSRLRRVDTVVTVNAGSDTGHSMYYRLGEAVNVREPSRRRPLAEFRGQTVIAVAAIGNPQRFFAMLRNAGLTLREHAFADHHHFQQGDLDFDKDVAVLMTEKDAVKCLTLATDRFWYVPLGVETTDSFGDWLFNALQPRD